MSASLKEAESIKDREKRYKTVSQGFDLTWSNLRYEEIYLHISCGENASSAMMFSFKPVAVYLPVDVNNVAFLQCEFPAEKNKDYKIH